MKRHSRRWLGAAAFIMLGILAVWGLALQPSRSVYVAGKLVSVEALLDRAIGNSTETLPVRVANPNAAVGAPTQRLMEQAAKRGLRVDLSLIQGIADERALKILRAVVDVLDAVAEPGSLKRDEYELTESTPEFPLGAGVRRLIDAPVPVFLLPSAAEIESRFGIDPAEPWLPSSPHGQTAATIFFTGGLTGEGRLSWPAPLAGDLVLAPSHLLDFHDLGRVSGRAADPSFRYTVRELGIGRTLGPNATAVVMATRVAERLVRAGVFTTKRSLVGWMIEIEEASGVARHSPWKVVPPRGLAFDRIISMQLSDAGPLEDVSWRVPVVTARGGAGTGCLVRERIVLPLESLQGDCAIVVERKALSWQPFSEDASFGCFSEAASLDSSVRAIYVCDLLSARQLVSLVVALTQKDKIEPVRLENAERIAIDALQGDRR